jgi:hypothetical protein
MSRDKTPDQVFTPRLGWINESMYVARPDLETALENALRGGMHVIVHGESGTGKSWLYKQVFKKLNAEVAAANLANASRFNSIEKELENVLERKGEAEKTGYDESGEAEAGFAPIAKAKVSHTGKYKLGKKEPLEACFKAVRSKAGSRMACIVLDNLETIFGNETLMKELADIIILLDDARYAHYKVKLLIVGVPAGLRDYFARTPHMSTVANRLYEIPEVSRLTQLQTAELVHRGFLKELKYQVSDKNIDAIVEHIKWVTDMIPQRIHEYCLVLAQAGEKKRSLDLSLLEVADEIWLSNSLSADYAAVESRLNSIETKMGRRNQCLYALGQIELDEFKPGDVEAIIRREFPKLTGETKDLNTTQIIAELANREPAILRRSPKGDMYRFKDPKYRMCIRAMLMKNPSEKVAKRDLRMIGTKR